MITTGGDYHRFTSYERLRMDGHFLDWSNQPDVYKDYPGLKVLPLPAVRPESTHKLSQLVCGDPVDGSPAAISLEQLSRVFDLACSLTARSLHAGREFTYRSVPSAGALYPCELYVASRALAGLPDGLYHYALGRHGLVPLRSGNFFESSSPDAPSDPSPLAQSLVFFVTAIFFRSAWKYRARAYRYHLMDSGHLVESLVLALKAHSLTHDLTFDFNDHEINTFLGCDTEREGCLAMVSVDLAGITRGIAATAASALPASFQAASRVAPKETTYPALQEFHEATSRVVAPAGSVPAGSVPDMLHEVGEFPASWQSIPPCKGSPEQMNYQEAVVRRRSQRNFMRETIPQGAFEALIACLSVENETPGSRSRLQRQSVVLGFLAGDVEGIDPGCYWLDQSRQRIGRVKAGAFTAPMAHSCLDQEWLERASLHFFIVANLEVLDAVWGPRGYRYAMLTAGRLGQRIYLGATSLGLGCCGIGAFYDGEAAALLGLNQASAMLYLLAVGPVKRALP
jgi:SagB-type dehydrogenase family enzyme